MKTTIELPDALFREAKSLAAREGMTLKSLISQALRDEIDHLSRRGEGVQPWRRHLGAMKELGEENRKIQSHIDDAFNCVDDELWT